MNKKPINIVWLKRDLRTQDHEPLHLAEKNGLPYLILFCFEPTLYKYPDTSLRHLQFQYHAVLAMNKTLEAYGKSVFIAHADAILVFKYLIDCYNVQHVFSHRESGTKITWERDKEIKKICIMMGGSDPQNYTLKVIKEINNFIIEKNIFVYIIFGKSNINEESIINFINNENYKIETLKQISSIDGQEYSNWRELIETKKIAIFGFSLSSNNFSSGQVGLNEITSYDLCIYTDYNLELFVYYLYHITRYYNVTEAFKRKYNDLIEKTDKSKYIFIIES